MHIDWFCNNTFRDIHYGHGFGGGIGGSSINTTSVMDSFQAFYNFVSHSEG